MIAVDESFVNKILPWWRKYLRIILPVSGTLVLVAGLGIGVKLASNTKQKANIRTLASFQEGSPAAKDIKGVMSLTDWGETPSPQIWTNSDVSGVVLRLYWKDLNPIPDTYNWQIIDSVLTQAKTAGKIVKISIAPGFYSPNWVLSQVPTQLFTVPQGSLKGQTAPLPIPWDDKYLQLWFDFITKLSEHVAVHPDGSALGYISLTGPNSHNGEVSLPAENKKDLNTWERLAGTDLQLENKMLEAWKKTMDHYQATFEPRGINFTLALILASLPIIGNPDLQWQYKQDLVNYPISKSMNLFGIQTNGLDGRPVCPVGPEPLPHWNLIKDYSNRLTGFQTNASTNLYNCTNISKIRILNQIVDNALSFKADFLEIYETDIFNSELTPAVKRANDLLDLPPASPTPIPTPTPSNIACKQAVTTLRQLTVDPSGIYLNWGGLSEKWFTGSGKKWYYILPTGKIYRWNNGLQAQSKKTTKDVVTLTESTCYQAIKKGYIFPHP